MTWEELEETAIDGRTCRRCKTWKPLTKFPKKRRWLGRCCSRCYYETSIQAPLYGQRGAARSIVVLKP